MFQELDNARKKLEDLYDSVSRAQNAMKDALSEIMILDKAIQDACVESLPDSDRGDPYKMGEIYVDFADQEGNITFGTKLLPKDVAAAMIRLALHLYTLPEDTEYAYIDEGKLR